MQLTHPLKMPIIGTEKSWFALQTQSNCLYSDSHPLLVAITLFDLVPLASVSLATTVFVKQLDFVLDL